MCYDVISAIDFCDNIFMHSISNRQSVKKKPQKSEIELAAGV
jgi:hypothetical protein